VEHQVNCPQCLKSQQIADHRCYVEGCMGCVVRKIAHMEPMERQRYLDRLQHLCGFDQRREVVKMVREEHARMAKLRERAKGMV
jgi:hypothetical protein